MQKPHISAGFNAQIKDAVASGREFFGPGVIELCKAADVVFMALHGANGEDGRVQAYFDLCGIPYTGTGYLSSAMAMDKGITKKNLSDFRCSDTTRCGTEKWGKDSMNLADYNMELPVVVKSLLWRLKRWSVYHKDTGRIRRGTERCIFLRG